MSELVVDQRLYYVPFTNRGADASRWLVVEKVGRKWATCRSEAGWGTWRIDRHTLLADGGAYSSPGRCYLSDVLYQSEQARNKAWNELQARMGHGGPPASLTEDQIRNFLGLLG